MEDGAGSHKAERDQCAHSGDNKDHTILPSSIGPGDDAVWREDCDPLSLPSMGQQVAFSDVNVTFLGMLLARLSTVSL